MIKQCRFGNVPFSMPGHATWIWLAQRAWTAKNKACLLPKQLGEQVAKLQVRALWECEFMALVMAQVWISREIMVLSREAAICLRCPPLAGELDEELAKPHICAFHALLRCRVPSRTRAGAA